MKQILYILLCICFYGKAQQYSNIKPNVKASYLKHSLGIHGKTLFISSKRIIFDIAIAHKGINYTRNHQDYEVGFNIYAIPLHNIPLGKNTVIVTVENNKVVFNIERISNFQPEEYKLDNIEAYYAIYSTPKSKSLGHYATKKEIYNYIQKNNTDKNIKSGMRNRLLVFAVYDKEQFNLNRSHSEIVYE